MTKFSIRTLEAMLLMALLLVAFLAWRLNRGPLPLDLITPYIEKALVGDQPMRVTIGRAVLTWRQLGASPVISVENVRAIDASGVIATLPRIDVEVSLLALLRGDLVPEELALSSPSLRVTRRSDGTFAFGLMEATSREETPDSEAMGRALIGALTQPAGDANRAGYLRRITVRGSAFTMRDEPSGQYWIVPNATLVLERVGEDVELSATFPVQDQNRPWSITVGGYYAAASRQLDLSLKVDGFRPESIAELATQLHPLRAADFAVSGDVRARFTLAENTARMDHVKFDLRGADGVIELPAPVSRGYAVRSLSLKGDITDSFDHITVENLRADLVGRDHEGVVITATGAGTTLNTAPAIAIDISLGELPLHGLKDYWPEGVKPNTRNWINRNLNGGKLSQTRFRIGLGGETLEALKLTELKGESKLSEIDVTYMKTMPPVEKTSGTMTIVPGEVAIAFSEGIVPDRQSGKGLRVRKGTVRLTNLGSPRETARVNLDIAGDLGEVMRLIDHEPLRYARAMGVDPQTPTGTTAVDLGITFPLVKDLDLDQLQIAVKGAIDGAQIPNVVFSQPLTDSHLALVLDNKGMDVSGTAVLGDIPAEIVWRENFGTGDVRSRYEIDTVLDNDQRKRVALTSPLFAPPYIDGPARAHVVYTTRRDGTATVESEADLLNVALAIPEAGWTKAAGEPARGTVSATLQKGQVLAVPAFRISAGAADELVGAAQFAEDGMLSKVTISTALLGETDVAGEMVRDEAGIYHLDAHGKAFDLGAYLRQLGRGDSEESSTAPQMQVDLRAVFDRVWIAKGADFRDVRLSYRQGASGIEAIDLHSTVDGEAPFTFTLAQQNGKRVFRGASPVGGAVVRASGLFDDIVGGTMKIDGEVTPDGAFEGKVDVQDFKLVHAPALARLLSVAALTGIIDELDGKGLSFKLLRVPFSYKQSIVRVHDGEMYGTGLGLTGKGTYNFAARQMDFEGTIIPAYAINSVLGSIPIIGKLLSGGEKGGGVLAATYQYQGDPATAQPSVNPLAALAPGFLRRFFDIFKSSPPQSALNPPPRPKAAQPGG